MILPLFYVFIPTDLRLRLWVVAFRPTAKRTVSNIYFVICWDCWFLMVTSILLSAVFESKEGREVWMICIFFLERLSST
jgi:hypothetical protein